MDFHAYNYIVINKTLKHDFLNNKKVKLDLLALRGQYVTDILIDNQYKCISYTDSQNWTFFFFVPVIV